MGDSNPIHPLHLQHLHPQQQQPQQNQQHQQLLLQQHHQQQLYRMQQQMQQQQRPSSQQQPQLQPQPQQPQTQTQQFHMSFQQQQAISRFPSNIDAHLRPPGLRSLHFQSHQATPSASSSQQQQSQPQQSNPVVNFQSQQPQQPAAAAAAARVGGIGVGAGRPAAVGNPVEVEMAQQDALKVCNPDFKRPFASIEDAVLRLLPYHVVSDYEVEEDDRILDSDTTGRLHSRLQQWDHNILAKIAEFTTTFEKQVLAFNIMSRKRALGEFRSEERLMIEQALMQEEKQALLELKAEIESREKAGREAAEAKMRMAMVQAEHARAAAQAHPEMIIRPPMRASSAASHGDEGSGHDMGQEEEIQGWGNAQRDDEEPSENFLNDENEPENGETGTQDEWREARALDLNSR